MVGITSLLQSSFGSQMTNVLTWYIIPVILGVIVLWACWIGWQFIQASDPAKRNDAKKRFLNAIAIVFIFAGVFTLMAGVNLSTRTGPTNTFNTNPGITIGGGGTDSGGSNSGGNWTPPEWKPDPNDPDYVGVPIDPGFINPVDHLAAVFNGGAFLGLTGGGATLGVDRTASYAGMSTEATQALPHLTQQQQIIMSALAAGYQAGLKNWGENRLGKRGIRGWPLFARDIKAVYGNLECTPGFDCTRPLAVPMQGTNAGNLPSTVQGTNDSKNAPGKQWIPHAGLQINTNERPDDGGAVTLSTVGIGVANKINNDNGIVGAPLPPSTQENSIGVQAAKASGTASTARPSTYGAGVKYKGSNGLMRTPILAAADGFVYQVQHPEADNTTQQTAVVLLHAKPIHGSPAFDNTQLTGGTFTHYGKLYASPKIQDGKEEKDIYNYYHTHPFVWSGLEVNNTLGPADKKYYVGWKGTGYSCGTTPGSGATVPMHPVISPISGPTETGRQVEPSAANNGGPGLSYTTMEGRMAALATYPAVKMMGPMAAALPNYNPINETFWAYSLNHTKAGDPGMVEKLKGAQEAVVQSGAYAMETLRAAVKPHLTDAGQAAITLADAHVPYAWNPHVACTVPLCAHVPGFSVCTLSPTPATLPGLQNPSLDMLQGFHLNGFGGDAQIAMDAVPLGGDGIGGVWVCPKFDSELKAFTGGPNPVNCPSYPGNAVAREGAQYAGWNKSATTANKPAYQAAQVGANAHTAAANKDFVNARRCPGCDYGPGGIFYENRWWSIWAQQGGVNKVNGEEICTSESITLRFIESAGSEKILPSDNCKGEGAGTAGTGLGHGGKTGSGKSAVTGALWFPTSVFNPQLKWYVKDTAEAKLGATSSEATHAAPGILPFTNGVPMKGMYVKQGQFLGYAGGGICDPGSAQLQGGNRAIMLHRAGLGEITNAAYEKLYEQQRQNILEGKNIPNPGQEAKQPGNHVFQNDRHLFLRLHMGGYGNGIPGQDKTLRNPGQYFNMDGTTPPAPNLGDQGNFGNWGGGGGGGGGFEGLDGMLDKMMNGLMNALMGQLVDGIMNPDPEKPTDPDKKSDDKQLELEDITKQNPEETTNVTIDEENKQKIADAGIKKVVIPATVRTVGHDAFSGMPIDGLTIQFMAPEKIVGFGDASFANLTNVKLMGPPASGAVATGNQTPDGPIIGLDVFTDLEYIGVNAFQNTTFHSEMAGKEMSPPAKVVALNDFAFANTNLSRNIKIPASVTSVGRYVYQKSGAVLDFTAATGLREIGPFAFADSGLTSLDLTPASNLMMIGEQAFANNTITAIKLPNSLKEIGDRAFWNNNIQSLRTDRLYQSRTASQLEKIGDSAFANNAALDGADFPDNLKWLGRNVFTGTAALTAANIEFTSAQASGNYKINSIRYIGNWAVELDPNGTAQVKTSVGELMETGESVPMVFYEKYMEDMYDARPKVAPYLAMTPSQWEAAYDVFENGLMTIYYGLTGQQDAYDEWRSAYLWTNDGATATGNNPFLAKDFSVWYDAEFPFKATPKWDVFITTFGGGSIVFAEGAVGMVNGLFTGAPNVTSVSFSSTFERIAENAFAGCQQLKTVDFRSTPGQPSKIKSIGAGAFADCVSLTKVDFGAGSQLTEISDRTFRGCWNLETIDNMPQTIIRIGDSAFENCYSLNSLGLSQSRKLPTGLVSLGRNAFSATPMLADAATATSGQSGVVSMDEWVVTAANPAATSFNLNIPGQTRVKIADYAFAGCVVATSVEIPSGAYVGAYAFSGWSNAQQIVVRGGTGGFSERWNHGSGAVVVIS